MPGLSDTLKKLADIRRGAFTNDTLNSSRLSGLQDFGLNPGALRAHIYIPEKLPDGAPLVVVLHGCAQTAAGYDNGAGWSEMADRHGFALLFPEQKRWNNPNLCFNWFSPEDNLRDCGEALSIYQMIGEISVKYSIDPERIFITGLSAGGAMASVMLAVYPEIFAGGAIIAGLPYGCANSIAQAIQCMHGHDLPGDDDLRAFIHGASDYAGPRPLISIWQGSADTTVDPVNADALIVQWREAHGINTTSSRTETVNGHQRQVWADGAGRDVIDEYNIIGLGHGTPVDTSDEEACGKAGAYMLEAGISSTLQICRFWDLTVAQDVATRPTSGSAIRVTGLSNRII